MKTALAENIKRIRREKGFTQEEIAEAMNVTVGTVHKWEQGKSLPDITTIMDLAAFFSVSVDYLVGFNKEDNNIDKTLNKLNSLITTNELDEALKIANSFLALHPNNYKLLSITAKIIEIRAINNITDDEVSFNNEINKAIEFLNKAKLCLDDVDNSKNELYKIDMALVDLYIDIGKIDKAIEALKDDNIGGVNDSLLAFLYGSSDKLDQEEAKLILTRSFKNNVDNLYQTLAGLLNYYELHNNSNSAIQVLIFLINLTNNLRPSDNIFYMDKYLGFYFYKLAEYMEKKNKGDEVYICLDKAIAAINRYDSMSTPTNRNIKFYLNSEVEETILGDMGHSAYDVINTYIDTNNTNEMILDIWNRLYKNKMK